MKINIEVPKQIVAENVIETYKESDVIIKDILSLSPVQISTWVDYNINDFEDAKKVLKRLLILAVFLLKRSNSK